MTVLYVVRHARTLANESAVFIGSSDLDDGLVERVPDVLQLGLPTDAVLYTSPLRRARTTAEALYPGRAATSTMLLRERDLGEWEGRAKRDVERAHPELFVSASTPDHRVTPPGGETWDSLLARVAAFVRGVPSTGDTVAVTHGNVVRAFHTLFFGTDPRSLPTSSIPHLSILRVEVAGALA